jgi:hypothetical protein
MCRISCHGNATAVYAAMLPFVFWLVFDFERIGRQFSNDGTVQLSSVAIGSRAKLKKRQLLSFRRRQAISIALQRHVHKKSASNFRVEISLITTGG